jgi:hypothetical protein
VDPEGTKDETNEQCEIQGSVCEVRSEVGENVMLTTDQIVDDLLSECGLSEAVASRGVKNKITNLEGYAKDAVRLGRQIQDKFDKLSPRDAQAAKTFEKQLSDAITATAGMSNLARRLGAK